MPSYYDVLAKNPGQLFRFYADNASFCHTESPTEASVVVTGLENVTKRIAELNLLDAHVDLSEGAYDVMSSNFAGNAPTIFLVITGNYTPKNGQTRPFTQSFVLSKQEVSGIVPSCRVVTRIRILFCAFGIIAGMTRRE